ncbi:MAG: LysR family transcriptional regulator [Vibrio splendidus]
MNSLHLKALLLAAETGSISAAARKLGKKQPQVSQWISDLEIDLGVNFFDRTGNKMSLSKDGERLLPYLTHTMSQLTKLVQSAEIISQGESTVLRIGIENYIPDLAFTQPLALTLELSHLCIEVYREEQHQLMRDLSEGNVDIIITHESDTLHHQHFEYCRLGHYKEVLACSPDHPLTKLPIVTSNDLSQYRELIWGETTNNNEQYRDNNSDGFSPSYGVFSDIQLLIAMLKHNKGFAFLPAEFVNTHIESGQLVALHCDFEPAGIDRRIELCWRNGLTLSPYGNQIVEAFKTHHQLSDKPIS